MFLLTRWQLLGPSSMSRSSSELAGLAVEKRADFFFLVADAFGHVGKFNFKISKDENGFLSKLVVSILVVDIVDFVGELFFLSSGRPTEYLCWPGRLGTTRTIGSEAWCSRERTMGRE
jgi:hypothetical protein